MNPIGRDARRMADSQQDRAALEDLVIRFTEAFNRDDLDAVMSFMAEDAIYDEFNGAVHRGKAAIREAFVPQFRGDYGTLRFHAEDLFVDAASGKALIRWLCTLETRRGPGGWRGLDILRFEHGLITEKLTYAKAKVPLLSEVPRGSRP
jgi:ketosteroid isomerase-like protein